MIELIQNVIKTTLLNGVTMASSVITDPVTIQNITCYAIQFSWTGFTAGGDELLSTQGSNDGEIWSTVDAFTPNGTADNNLLNVEKAGYRFVRVKYDADGGTGTLKVTISGKVI